MSNNTSIHIPPIDAKGLKAAGAGALGGFAGFLGTGILVGPFFDSGIHGSTSLLSLLFQQGITLMVIGTVLSAAILAYDNLAGLRGRWNRDLVKSLPLFAGVSFLSGSIGQFIYSIIGLTRGIPWLLMGGAIGAGIGLLRRDRIQAQRGALGGALGGLTGGILVDCFLALNPTDAAFVLASQIGIVIMGAAIAFFMRLVQEALKSAWLMGVSAGPYEGKEYLLNTDKVTVGRSEASDIALFRDRSIPEQLGAFVFQNGNWWWQGNPVAINGTPQAQVQLQPGDTIQLGDMRFRYQNRAFRTPAPATPSQATPVPAIQTSATSAASAPPLLPPVPGSAAHNQSAIPAVFASPAHYQPSAASQSAFLTPHAVLAGQSPALAWSLRSLSASNPINLPSAPAQVSIGRAPGNTVILNDDFISSQHALLNAGPDALSITDLGSTNGTKVNGQLLTPHMLVTLRNGDRLVLGRLEYVVEQA